MLSKIKWCLKQLVPLTYVSVIGKDLCIWKMWFGKPFHIQWYELR